MHDISDRRDIEILVNSFYEKVLQNETIGYIFTEVVQIDLPKHLPVMYDFWETMLLDHMVYKGNAMQKHIELDKKEKLHPRHFEAWLSLWTSTVKENFEGPRAEEAVKRAGMIAQLMKHKVSTQQGSIL